jgi:hypothetical protein
MCESSGGAKAIAVVVIVVTVAVGVGVPLFLIARAARGDRGSALATWVGAIVLGTAPAFAGGDDGVELRWLAGVAAAIAASVAVAAWRRRPVLAALGLLGALAPVVIVLVGGIGGLFLTDECFDTSIGTYVHLVHR